MTAGLLGLAGVVLGAVLTTFLTLFKDRWMASQIQERQAYYLAIRVVCVLDQYMESCAQVACDDGLGEGELGPNANTIFQVEEPQKPTYADDIDWRSIDADLMYRILSFPNEIDDADKAISGEWDSGGAVCAINERQYQYAKLGLTAASITDELRQRYAIPLRTFSEWSPVETLKSVKQSQERRKANLEATAEPLYDG